jgi:hypothetical protein
MKIFNVVNAENFGAFIMAEDKEDALDVALNIGHIRAKGGGPVTDITDQVSGEPGMRELIDQKYRGRLAKQLSAYTFDEALAGVKKNDARWIPIKNLLDVREF